MILFHGTKKELPLGDNLRTPTGKSSMDVVSGGVVYLTDNPQACKRYGKIYEIEAQNPIPYAEQRLKQNLRKKKGRFTRGVWVALPEDTIILRVRK